MVFVLAGFEISGGRTAMDGRAPPCSSIGGKRGLPWPLDREQRATIRSGVPLRCIKSGPLDRDRVVQVRSGRIKSTPSDRDPVPLIAYRFAAR
jgi:hypothetical protein